MHRRTFVHALAASLAVGPALSRPRRVPRVGIQLYTLRTAARADLERTLADLAAIGYGDVELLDSMGNFGMAPATLRAVLDRVGLRATSTHVAPTAFDDLSRLLGDAATLGHEYVVLADIPGADRKSLDGFRRWADRLNEAAVVARKANVWVAFHNHAQDFAALDGRIAYDVFVERLDPSLVRLQLDTGNLAMTGRDPMTYLERHADRYWSFHVKDVPRLGAPNDVELGAGVLDFRKLLARAAPLDGKRFFVEQETYPGAPLDSARRDFAYLSALEF